ncbi:MAG TPA: DUF6677 family protein [Kofleriaceae bacterium]|jgi:TM2 domain-containing membrane protein YozV
MLPRIIDPDQIEQRMLELAFTSDAKITAPALAYFAPCSIDGAQKVLDKLAAEERVQMDVEDDGTVVYHVPARAKLAPITPPPQTHALVPAVRGMPPAHAYHANPAVAIVLAALFPGAGHLYAGRFASALLWFVAISVGYFLIVPGLILHLASIISAGRATAAPGYHAMTWS